MNNLVCLAEFRQRNGLSQGELGRLLGTSSSYISSVESGNGKFSFEKMQKLWALGEGKWFMEDLVPAYTRLCKVRDEALWSGGTAFAEAFEKAVPAHLMESIKYGQQGIDLLLADKIIDICPPDVHFSKIWLVAGEGEMYSKPIYVDGEGVKVDAEKIFTLLSEIKKKQEDLEGMIIAIRDSLLKKS